MTLVLMLRQCGFDSPLVTLKRRQGLDRSRQLPRAKVGATAGEPVWNTIMPAGEWHRRDFPDGVVKCDRDFFEACIANWKKIGSPGLPIDRHHWGSSDDTRIRAEDKGAVGFIEDLRISAGGDLEGLTRWNADGRGDIENDRRRYFSPEWHENWTDIETGEPQGPTFFGGGLLNDPFFLGHLQRMAANDAPSKEQFMNRTQLIALYGLAATATDAEIETAVKAGAEARTASRSASEEEQKRTAAAAKRTGELEEENKKLKASAEKLELEKTEQAGKALCDKLETEGRIVASEKSDVLEDVKSMGIEKATARWSKRSVIVKGLDGGKPADDKNLENDPKKAGEQFNKLVDEEMEKSKIPFSQASRRVGAAHPELYVKAMQAAAVGAGPGDMRKH